MGKKEIHKWKQKFQLESTQDESGKLAFQLKLLEPEHQI